VRLIEIIANEGHGATLEGIAEQHQASDIWWGTTGEDGRRVCHMLVSDDHRQAVMDALQNCLGKSAGSRVLVMSVDASLLLNEPATDDDTSTALAATREELFSEVSKGARTDGNYLMLVCLSTIVAAVGLLEDSVAVVIGAMVIAPLLGPNIALALATVLGDRKLAWKALQANLLGLCLAFGVSCAIGVLWTADLNSDQLMSRTHVGLADIALALASGAAAVLSLTTGLSSTLVGVMVAVALLPPTATVGILIGSGAYPAATGAALLLAINVICVSLAANVVFLAKGIRPRTWLARRKARQSWTLQVTLWGILLLVAVVVLYRRGELGL
jgi:uncharacterized hydrophobic protein (TIGR00341 family)